MVIVALVLTEPTMRHLLAQMLISAISEFKGFDVTFSDTLREAAHLVSDKTSALVLFDCPQVNSELLAEVRHLRTVVPACVVCALSVKRRFYHDEPRALQKAGVHFMLEESTVTDATQLIAELQNVVTNLAASRVLASFPADLTTVTLRAARTVLASVCGLGDDAPRSSASRVRAARQELGKKPKVSAERVDIAVRLLLLIDLVETSRRPIAALYSLAAFPTSKDACELIRSYTMVASRQLTFASERNRARARLIQVLLGHAQPDRRRSPPMTGIRNQESGIRK